MVQSMTGYGRGETGLFTVEVRSTNHKYLDILTKTPPALYRYEDSLRKALKERFSRGRFEVIISIKPEKAVRLRLNMAIAREMFDNLNSLKKEFSLSGDIGIDMMSSYRDILFSDELVFDPSDIDTAFDSAISGLERMRFEEGRAILEDIRTRLELIDKYVGDIKGRCGLYAQNCRSLLIARVKEFIGDSKLDESRILQEVAILAERADITEEVVRIGSHINQFRKTMKSEDPMGRKLDFLLQEMHREVNTISSKANDADISHMAVEIKSEIERVREQVQNLQ